MTAAEKTLAEKLEALADQLMNNARELLEQAAILTGRSISPLGVEDQEIEDQRIQVQDQRIEDQRIEEEIEEETRHRLPDGVKGSRGLVTEKIAIKRAKELGEFTREQYAEALGLSVPGTFRWLTSLVKQDVLVYENGTYVCVAAPTVEEWVIGHKEPFSVLDCSRVVKLSEIDTKIGLDALVGRKILRYDTETLLYSYVPPDPSLSPREHETKTPPEKLPPCGVDSLATGMPVRVAATQKATRRQRSVAGAGGIKGVKAKDKRYNEMMAKRKEKAEERKGKAQKDPKWKSRNGRRAA